MSGVRTTHDNHSLSARHGFLEITCLPHLSVLLSPKSSLFTYKEQMLISTLQARNDIQSQSNYVRKTPDVPRANIVQLARSTRYGDYR